MRRHLVEHASAGAVLDEQVLSPRFLPFVDGSRLRAVLPRSPAGVLLDAWRRVAYMWRWDQPAANADALQFSLVGAGGRPDQVVHPGSTWRALWHCRSAEQEEIFTHLPGFVSAVAASTLSDGRLVVVTGDDRAVRVWDLTAGTPVGDPLTGHTGPVTAVATSTLPDGRSIVVTGHYDATVRVWDLITQVCVAGPVPVITANVMVVYQQSGLLVMCGDGVAAAQLTV